MIADFEGQLTEDEKMLFPRGSWNVFKILYLHQKYCPKSRVRVVWRFLLFTCLASMASIFIIMIYAAFSKPPAPPRKQSVVNSAWPPHDQAFRDNIVCLYAPFRAPF
jgi:hypothetical protein